MTTHTDASDERPAGQPMRVVIWLAGLLVAVAAAVATAHGLFEVAVAARVPAAIAWLYPLITDGLALVAYAASARLAGSASRYAWSVVVLAAGLSGLAQAMFLASDAPHPAPGVPDGEPVQGAEVVGPVFEASAALRFGVGAWPAVAAAIVAHLLYLLATDHAEPDSAAPAASRAGEVPSPAPAPAVDTPAALFKPDAVQRDPFTVQPREARTVQTDPAAAVQRAAAVAALPSRTTPTRNPAEQPARSTAATPARDRAHAAATRHTHRHGQLPTVSELEAAAQVSRGTAATVLKALREQPTPLHLITSATRTDLLEDDLSIEEHTQR